MPYVKQEIRNFYVEHGNLYDLGRALATIKLPAAKGDLNFIVTYLVKNWLEKNGLDYYKGSTMIDALRNAATELDRTVMGPLEDLKRKENGDV